MAVTMPPPHYFGGVDYAFAEDMAGELRRLGATVFPLGVDGFIDRDGACIRDAVQALRSFHPDLAISLPNAAYAILCATPESQNVFRDILQIPTILIWDHGALQFSQLLLKAPPKSPAEASLGSIDRLRSALDHPLFLHYSPDKGHIAVVDRLGILDAGKVRPFVHFAFPAYTGGGHEPPPGEAPGPRLAFAGNVYLERSQRLPYRSDPILAALESRMLDAKKTQLTASFWDLLLAEIDRCDESTRKKLGLHPDSTFFWSFMHDEIELVGNTSARVSVLTALGHECEFFGNFMEPQAASRLWEQYGIRYQGSLNCVSQLPSLYRNSGLIVDVIHAGYISGSSPKVTSCLACGGLILFDYKSDFREGLGEIADRVMYRSLDHLHSLIEEYLGHPDKRRAVARELRHRVLREFTFAAFCKRVLADQPAWRT